MSDTVEYPRWLYLDNDLARGRIVHSEQEANGAAREGYAEFDSALPPKLGPQRRPATVPN